MVIIDLINHSSELHSALNCPFFSLAARDKIITPLVSLKMQLIDSASPRRLTTYLNSLVVLCIIFSGA